MSTLTRPTRTRRKTPQTSAPKTRLKPEHREIAHLLPLYDIGGQAYFGYRVVLAARLFDRCIVDILEDNAALSLPQWRIVAQLGLIATGTVRSLADGAAVDRAEVSRAIQELIRLGLVVRTENTVDRRSPTFTLTKAGRRNFNAVREPIGRFIRHLVDGLDPKELDAANKVLWAITKGCLQGDAS
jgi:DNA-binding MarR family transcriptional regulator